MTDHMHQQLYHHANSQLIDLRERVTALELSDRSAAEDIQLKQLREQVAEVREYRNQQLVAAMVLRRRA